MGSIARNQQAPGQVEIATLRRSSSGDARQAALAIGLLCWCVDSSRGRSARRGRCFGLARGRSAAAISMRTPLLASAQSDSELVSLYRSAAKAELEVLELLKPTVEAALLEASGTKAVIELESMSLPEDSSGWEVWKAAYEALRKDRGNLDGQLEKLKTKQARAATGAVDEDSDKEETVDLKASEGPDTTTSYAEALGLDPRDRAYTSRVVDPLEQEAQTKPVGQSPGNSADRADGLAADDGFNPDSPAERQGRGLPRGSNQDQGDVVFVATITLLAIVAISSTIGGGGTPLQ